MDGRSFRIPDVRYWDVNVNSEACDRERDNIDAVLGVVQQLLLKRFGPACALVNRTLEVLCLHGPTDEYLQLPAGEPSINLLAMAREGLRSPLRATVGQAVDQGKTATTVARVRRDGKYHHVRITAESLGHSHEAEGLILVTFVAECEAGGSPASNPVEQISRLPKARSASNVGGSDACPTSDVDPFVAQLEEELRSSRSPTRGLIEELETSSEKMKAAQEEAAAVNEELLSANEELETSKEELQSLNEELTTVNSQLEAKVSELQQTNNDLHNRLTSIETVTQRLKAALQQQVAVHTAQLTDADRDLQIAIRTSEEARTALRAGEEEFRAMFELAAVGIAQVDAAGRFLRINPKFCEMLGYSSDELRGKNFLDVTHPADRESDAVLLSQLVSNACDPAGKKEFGSRFFGGLPNSPDDAELPATPPIEKRYLRKDGSPLWAAVQTTLVLDAAGCPVTAIRVALDLTYRRELERRLAEVSEGERQRLGRELHDTLGQQITAIALQATRLHSLLAADSSRRDGQAEGLLDMIDEAQRQVRSLLSGMLPVEFDARGLTSALSDLADRTQARHEIDCRFECHGLGPIHDTTAAMHLYRIAQEAVHNAVKHSRASHLVVRLHDGSGLTLEICDDGIGFAQMIDVTQTRPTGATPPGGAGLGIMRYRAQLIGGRLSIRSANPQGTIIECRLQVEPS
jgi:two-component system CheB/CheR fusion protein